MNNPPKTPQGFFQRHIITLIIVGLLTVIFLLLFSDFSEGPAIEGGIINPYVLATKGKTLIFREKLVTIEANDQAFISVGDRIRTLIDSTATIFWPDGSITRLGEKSSIKIREMSAKSISENIRIDFSLEQGKSWSNVIRYLFDGSYFHERFNDDTVLATVRGTVFEINLDQKYVHTVDHAVSIEEAKESHSSLLLTAGSIIDTEKMTTLGKSVLDEAWNTLNTNEDIAYIKNRMELFKERIAIRFGQHNYFDVLLHKLGIGNSGLMADGLLKGDKKVWDEFEKNISSTQNSKEIQASLLNFYEEINAFQNTPSLLQTKIRLRDAIIAISSEQEKKGFLDDFARSTLYDTWKATSIGTGIVQELQKKLEEYIRKGADKTLIEKFQKASGGNGVNTFFESIENLRRQTIETLEKEDLLEKAESEMNQENLEKMNNKIIDVRIGITDTIIDYIRNLFTK